MSNDLFHARINEWTDALRADYLARGKYDHGVTFEQAPPRGQFSRIVQLRNGQNDSVHAFLDVRTGDVYKAEGWKRPAKHVRFNLLDDESFQRMLANLDWAGSYLYLR